MNISQLLSSTQAESKLNLQGMKATGIQGQKKNKFLEKAMQIAFSDASPEEKKLMFQNLKQEMAAEGLKVQFEEIEKLQERINEEASEAVDKSADSGIQDVNEQGDVAVISQEAQSQFERSAVGRPSVSKQAEVPRAQEKAVGTDG